MASISKLIKNQDYRINVLKQIEYKCKQQGYNIENVGTVEITDDLFDSSLYLKSDYVEQDIETYEKDIRKVLKQYTKCATDKKIIKMHYNCVKYDWSVGTKGEMHYGEGIGYISHFIIIVDDDIIDYSIATTHNVENGYKTKRHTLLINDEDIDI